MNRVSVDRLRRADRIFKDVLDRPPAERSGFLARVCGSDQVLRRKLDRLLAADSRATTFLERPVHHPPPPCSPEPRPDGARGVETIGPYQVLATLGRGGMGKVYLAAHRADPRHRVALKILHRGLDDPETLRRFRRERLFLARLRHPHVARLLGGGTARDGRPYLVMEYVEGRPIDQYCDLERLSIGERLELFRTVCGAVQYLHRHHLVHRDLKPDNILVTERGEPKLLDFGIAKLLDRARIDLSVETTTAGVRLMTPGYASPEQYLGRRVTPASDVYTLGVLLCRLLAGHLPYRTHEDRPRHVSRAICHEPPLAPSVVVTRHGVLPGGLRVAPAAIARARGSTPRRLRRRLAGDLDAIVARALDKSPERRYATAAELGRDVVRHLCHRPVTARRPTLMYRAGKLARRHGRALGAAALFVALALGWLLA